MPIPAVAAMALAPVAGKAIEGVGNKMQNKKQNGGGPPNPMDLLAKGLDGLKGGATA